MARMTPLAVVEQYHEKYLEYENAFNNDSGNREEIEMQLKKLIDLGLDEESEEFNNKMVDIMIDKPQKQSDVNNAAYKFYLFTEFYILTQEEALPENIKKDYESLPIKDNIKNYFSIESGKFVKNQENGLTDNMRDYFKSVVEQVKKMQT
jgi:hypothetical protein